MDKMESNYLQKIYICLQNKKKKKETQKCVSFMVRSSRPSHLTLGQLTNTIKTDNSNNEIVCNFFFLLFFASFFISNFFLRPTV